MINLIWLHWLSKYLFTLISQEKKKNQQNFRAEERRKIFSNSISALGDIWGERSIREATSLCVSGLLGTISHDLTLYVLLKPLV